MEGYLPLQVNYLEKKMDIMDIVSKLWPIVLAGITLVVVLAKMDQRVAMLEEKTKILFDFHNKEHYTTHKD